MYVEKVLHFLFQLVKNEAGNKKSFDVYIFVRCNYRFYLMLICKNLSVSHVDTRSGTALQNICWGADGATAAVPRRAPWREPDAPHCHSRSSTLSSLTQTSDILQMWHFKRSVCSLRHLFFLTLNFHQCSSPFCVQTPGAVCARTAGCGGGAAATSFQWNCRKIVSGTRAPSSASNTTAVWL